jgi:hypothetical protein
MSLLAVCTVQVQFVWNLQQSSSLYQPCHLRIWICWSLNTDMSSQKKGKDEKQFMSRCWRFLVTLLLQNSKWNFHLSNSGKVKSPQKMTSPCHSIAIILLHIISSQSLVKPTNLISNYSLGHLQIILPSRIWELLMSAILCVTLYAGAYYAMFVPNEIPTPWEHGLKALKQTKLAFV